MTRTHQKHMRIYVDGVDLSGYSRSVGALGLAYGAEPDAAMSDAVKNILIGQGDITAGPINAFVDNDTAGLFALANAGTGTRNVLAVIGANAAPAAGNPAFAWQFEQTSYAVEQGSGFVSVNIPLMTSHAGIKTYSNPWGSLLHANTAAVIAANTAIGIDDNGASSALGGIFIYHLLSSDGTVTLTAEEADTNTDVSFAAITGATSGSITAAVTPKSGMIALGKTAAIKRYLRWQIAFTLGTTATFVTAFIRG